MLNVCVQISLMFKMAQSFKGSISSNILMFHYFFMLGLMNIKG